MRADAGRFPTGLSTEASRQSIFPRVAPKEAELPSGTADLELQNVYKHMKLENPEDLSAAVHQFLSDCLPHSSVVSYHLFIMELIGRLGSFARDNGLEMESAFGEDPTSLDLQQRDPEALGVWMNEVCLRMQKQLSGQRKSSTENLVQKAKSYVQEHYSEPDLSLNSICSFPASRCHLFLHDFPPGTRAAIQYLSD